MDASTIMNNLNSLTAYDKNLYHEYESKVNKCRTTIQLLDALKDRQDELVDIEDMLDELLDGLADTEPSFVKECRRLHSRSLALESKLAEQATMNKFNSLAVEYLTAYENGKMTAEDVDELMGRGFVDSVVLVNNEDEDDERNWYRPDDDDGDDDEEDDD